jgi:branched-chain amino acid transport system substrate-binding protein
VAVGAILPLTGTAANYGELMKRGITVALDEAAAGASKPSNRLNLIIEDSKSNPKDGVSALHKLLQADKVAAVMPALSSVVLAAAPIAEQNKIVLLNAPANSPKLRGAGDFVFNIMILSDQESEFLANYAFNRLGAKTAAVVFVNNESGRGYRESFVSKFQGLGGAVKLSEGHDQGATDFRTTIEKLRSAQVDLVFLASYYAESALLLKQCKELGFKAKWLSYSSVETPDFLKLVGDAADGLIYSQPGLDIGSTDPVSRRFVDAYRKKYGQDPDLWSAQFYDGTRLLASAIDSGARTGEQMRTYLKNLKNFSGISGPISFDDKGGVTREVRFKTINNGKFEYLEGGQR